MLQTRFYQVPKRETLTMVPRVGTVVVRRSPRLVAAVATENPGHSGVGDSTFQKTPEAQSGPVRRSKIARTTESQMKKSRENNADIKDENGKVQRKPTNVKVESISDIQDFGAKEVKTLRRTKSLKKFPSRDLEMTLWELGFRNVAGVDEAGRGPLAGPVVAAACIIPASVTISGVDDSKKLNEAQREELYDQIVATPGVAYAIHVVDAAKIDEINILQATLLAMSTCVKKLRTEKCGQSPDYILIDGNRIPDDLSKEEARFVIKGDAECHVIAAASILAKVTRDRMMVDYDKRWPVYGFKAHKGYGTAAHMGALLKHGPCDIHRRSFAPLKNSNILPR